MTADGWLEVDGVTVNKKDGTFNTDKLKADWSISHLC